MHVPEATPVYLSNFRLATNLYVSSQIKTLLRDSETINVDADGCNRQRSGRSADDGFLHFDLWRLSGVIGCVELSAGHLP